MYTYHYQNSHDQLIFRYDNALHKPTLSSRDHKHLPDKMVEVPVPALGDVILEIVLITGWM